MADGRRFRQHVNPLGARYLAPRAGAIRPPVHLGAGCHVEVELGCADAQFSFALAQSRPDWFVVGLDIRDGVIARNSRIAQQRGRSNVAFGYVNLTVDLDQVFPSSSVDRFHLLFPDPWFKSRHRKRRVVDEDLCRTLHRQLRSGGEVHVASDQFEIALEIMEAMEGSAGSSRFRNLESPWAFCRTNPFGITSRREDITVARGQRVWRIRYAARSSGDETPPGETRSRR